MNNINILNENSKRKQYGDNLIIYISGVLYDFP